VLDEFERSNRVLAVKITSNGNTANTFFGEYTVVMTVLKVYKGDLNPGDEIELIQGRSSVDYIFSMDDVGKEFLLYYNGSGSVTFISEQKETFLLGDVSQCGRTKRLSDAAEDILYLDNLSSVRGKTRISGQLITYGERKPDLNGRRVLIRRNGKTWELYTDSNGVFEIYDLPAGEYEIETAPPDNWKYQYALSRAIVFDKPQVNLENGGRIITVAVEEGKHASLSITFSIDVPIRGRVLSPDNFRIPEFE